ADAAFEYESVQVHKFLQALSHGVRHTRYHDAAVAVADQDDVVQVFPDQYIGNIVDKGVEADAGIQQVAPLTEASQRRRKDIVSRGPKARGNPGPAPAAVPRPMYQNEVFL